MDEIKLLEIKLSIYENNILVMLKHINNRINKLEDRIILLENIHGKIK